MTNSVQITTLSFFRYKGFKNKVWAFFMMQFAHKHLQNVSGMSFYKLMGSGKGLGFNPFPDWSVYCLLQVWDDEKDADHFFLNSELMEKYREHSLEQWSVYMRNISVHGKWSGSNPFKSVVVSSENPLIAVITRAKIRKRCLLKFWRFVPTSQKPLTRSEGLIYTKGIGEVPVLNMATFSIWQNLDSLKQFAYHSPEHKKAIQKTRDLNWYSEELFSRFQPYKTLGNWGKINLDLKKTT